MEINRKIESYGYSTPVFSKVIEESINQEITLPDYMPDIVRIVKSELSTGITSYSVVGERVTAEISIQIRILYCCEEGILHSWTQSYSVSRYCEAAGILTGDVVCVRSVSDYINCRAASQRKLDASGKLSVSVKVNRHGRREILCGADGGGIQIKSEPHKIASLEALTEKTFSLSDVFELPAAMDNIRSIVSTDATAIVTDAKLISGKVMLRGEFTIDIAYIPESRATKTEHYFHRLPVNQIIEAEGVNENTHTDINLTTLSLEVVPKSKSDGTVRLIDASASIAASISGYEDKLLSVITDAYSTEYSTDIAKSNFEIKAVSSIIDESYTVREQMDVSTLQLNEILDMNAVASISEVVVADGRANVSGTVTSSVLAVNSQSQIVSFERAVDYSFGVPTVSSGENSSFSPTVTVTRCEHLLPTSERLEIRAELLIRGTVFTENSVDAVETISASTEHSSRVSGRAVTIYFTEDNENLWNIAKRYNTTVEAVCAENDIPDDEICEKRMLFIPGI